jgi:hypothetical protein
MAVQLSRIVLAPIIYQRKATSSCFPSSQTAWRNIHGLGETILSRSGKEIGLDQTRFIH